MRAKEIIRKRSINIKTGKEGPDHDPYAYEELTVTTNAKEVKVHLGLDCYLKVFGQKDKDTEHCTDLVMKAFERHVGCSYKSIVRAFYKLRSICPHCNSRKGFLDYEGYPGEILYVCRNCRAIAHSYLNEAAII